MRTVAILSLLLFLTTPAFSELTKEDLQTLKEDLRTIIKEEITASEKRTREYIDLKTETINTKIDALEKRIDDLKGNINRIWLAILALIAAAVALPQLIIVYTERKREKEIQLLIQQLREQVETTKNASS